MTFYAGLALACWTSVLSAQTDTRTNVTIRSLSREECIRLALEHNLDIRIQRYTPLMQSYKVQGDYGAYYDPTLAVNGGRTYSRNSITSINAGTPTVANETTSDGFSASLSGSLPSATAYSVSTFLFHDTGTTSGSPVDKYNTGLGLASLTQHLLQNGFWCEPGSIQIQIDKKTLQMNEFDLQYKVMSVVTLVQQAYYDLIASKDAVKVAEKALELAQQLLAETKRKVQVGVATPLDEKQVEAQVQTSIANLNEARRVQLQQENILKTFLTDDYRQWYNATPVPTEQLIAVPESYDLSESWQEALTLRPDYNKAKTAVEQQGIVVKQKKNAVLPALDLIGKYGRSGLDTSGSFSGSLDQIDDNRNPNYAVLGQLSFPIGNGAARYSLRSARAAEEQLKDQLRLLHLNVMVTIENAVNLAKSKFDQVTAFRQARVFAEAALDAEQKKLENGKSTPFFVLDFQNRLIAAQANELRALSDYNKALVQLYFEEGTTLQRNKIEVTYK